VQSSGVDKRDITLYYIYSEKGNSMDYVDSSIHEFRYYYIIEHMQIIKDVYDTHSHIRLSI